MKLFVLAVITLLFVIGCNKTDNSKVEVSDSTKTVISKVDTVKVDSVKKDTTTVVSDSAKSR